jgi:subtilisin family serine protease
MDRKLIVALLVAALLVPAAALASPWDGPRSIHDGADLDRRLSVHPIPGVFTVTWSPGPQDSWVEGQPRAAVPAELRTEGFVLEHMDGVGAPRLHTEQYRLVASEADAGDVARALMGLPDVVLAAPLFELEPGGPWRAVTPKILLQLADPFYEADLFELADRLGLQVDRKRGLAPDQWRLRVPADSELDPVAAATALHASPITRWAEVSWIQQRSERHTPADDMYGNQWHLDNTGQGGGIAGHDMNAPEAWDITTGSAEVIIAILDSGVDTDHPDLQDNLLAGWDFVNDDSDPNPGGSSHGTSCAGTAAAPDQGTGVVGVCPDCLIIPIRMLGADDESEADASDFAVNNGAWLISNSWGPTDGTGTFTPISSAMATSVDFAVTDGRGGLGTAVFWAAGNGHPNDTCDQDGFVAYPSTIAVGSSSNLGLRSSYSEHCDELDLSAPSSGGSNGTAGVTTTNIGGYTSSFGGTSAASPAAAGVAGLVLSVMPDLGWEALRQLLIDTAEKIDPGGNEPADYDATGHSRRYGYGRVDAEAALAGELALLSVDSSSSDCEALLEVTVQWSEGAGVGALEILATSSLENSEVFVLPEGAPGVFEGGVQLSQSGAVAGDGLLAVASADSLVISSLDLDQQAEVHIDCVSPQIIDPRVEQITYWGALLAWETSEDADSYATWGSAASQEVEDTALGIEHSLWAIDLEPCSDYVATIASTDDQGNTAELVDALSWTTEGDWSLVPDDAPEDADPCDPSTWEPGDDDDSVADDDDAADDDDDDEGRDPGGMTGSGGGCSDCGGNLGGAAGGGWMLALIALVLLRRRAT